MKKLSKILDIKNNITSKSKNFFTNKSMAFLLPRYLVQDIDTHAHLFFHALAH